MGSLIPSPAYSHSRVGKPGNEAIVNEMWASVESGHSFFFACTQGRSSKKSYLGKCLQQVRGMGTMVFYYKLLSKLSLVILICMTVS